MEITKRAVTVIGVRVPVDKISHEEDDYLNLCKCHPQTLHVDGIYCPGCGQRVYRTYIRRVLEDFVKLTGDDAFELIPHIDNYLMVGNWHEDKYVYIGYLVSSTKPAYSAKSVDPARCDFTLMTTDEDEIQKFIDSMRSVGLWKSEEFGIWTMMLSE